jgi:ATP-dependent RNA helicase DDX46/PRP5
MEGLARKILHTPVEIQVGGRSVVAKEVEQHVVVSHPQNNYFSVESELTCRLRIQKKK